jgi:hypothetical protein
MNNENVPVEDRSLSSRVAHVIGRTGLAMSGAVSGTFVAAQLVRFCAELFDLVGFIASMIVIGTVGFYLGIDIPQPPPPELGGPTKANPVELFSAKGTFLAAIATLISVWAIVFDEIPSRIWEFAIGSWWILGVFMQIGAGLTGRLRLARRAAT